METGTGNPVPVFINTFQGKIMNENIYQRIRDRVGNSIRNLKVFMDGSSIVICGVSRDWHSKQLAQAGLTNVKNLIEVSNEKEYTK